MLEITPEEILTRHDSRKKLMPSGMGSSLRVLLPNKIELICSSDEFVEIYPSLIAHERSSRKKQMTRRKEPSQYEAALQAMKKEPDRAWTPNELTVKTKLPTKAAVNVLRRAADNGSVKKTMQGRYSFVPPEKKKSQGIVKTAREYVRAMSDEMFNDMLEQAKPLLTLNGCSELELTKQFKTLPACFGYRALPFPGDPAWHNKGASGNVYPAEARRRS